MSSRFSSLRRWSGVVVGASMVLAACGSESTADVASEATQAPTEATTESTAAEEAAGTESGFPQFTADTVDGSQIDFGSLEGQDTVLWFWAPW